MVDRSGQPIWYLDDPAAWLDVEILEDGRIFGLADGRPTFTDWGDLQRETIHLDDHRPLHHDVALLPDDQGILGLTFENRLVSELPDNYVEACTSGSPGVILDNPVVWVDMAGNLLGYLPLVDRLDPGRIGFGALAPTATGGVDWAHANGIAPVPGEDAFLVSVRSQDAVIKVNGDGSLEWILANPYGWSPQYQALRLRPEDSGFRWFWHQHAPVPGPDGSLLIYDNGNYQANPCGPPPTEERQTRLVEIEIDEENWTFRERWSWQSGLFSSAMGNATWLEDGRLGVVMAMLFHDEEGVAHTDLGLGQRAARLLVLDPATGEVGWELRATSTNQVSEAGWTIPRADWLDSPWSPG